MMVADTKNKFQAIHILAISGSLRQVSSNTALLQAAIALSPEDVEMKLYGGLGDLPHFNTSPRSIHAQASLTKIVTTVAGRIVPEASITVSLLGKNLNATGIAADPEISGQVQSAIITFVSAIQQFQLFLWLQHLER